MNVHLQSFLSSSDPQPRCCWGFTGAEKRLQAAIFGRWLVVGVFMLTVVEREVSQQPSVFESRLHASTQRVDSSLPLSAAR